MKLLFLIFAVLAIKSSIGETVVEEPANVKPSNVLKTDTNGPQVGAIKSEDNENEKRSGSVKLGFALPTIKIALPTLPNILPTALPKITIPNIEIPTVKIPEIIPKTLPTLPNLIPTVEIPEIIPKTLPTLPNLIPTVKIPDIIPKTLPTLPNLIPTVENPDIIPKTLPTLPNLIPTALPEINLPTIKLPTLPHLLPTALPTLFPPKNTETGNIICDVCENAVTVVKTRFQTFEKVVRNNLTTILSNVCNILGKFEPLAILSTPCNVFKADLIDDAFKKLDEWEAKLSPKTVCKILPFCK